MNKKIQLRRRKDSEIRYRYTWLASEYRANSLLGFGKFIKIIKFSK